MTLPALRDRPCPICGSNDALPEVRGHADGRTMEELRPFWFGIEKERRFFTYHRCRCCGLLYNRSFFDNVQLADLYAQMPPNMELVQSDAIAATQSGYFGTARMGRPPSGDYLEIGPDVGYIVHQAAECDSFRHFWLFEPNRAVHDALREAAGDAPITVLPDMNDLSAVPDGSIGLAVMVHVLDHLLDPLSMLVRIRPKLHADAVLLIVTHDERSALRRVLGSRWPAFCLQHPELYNPATIRQLLRQAGFDKAKVSRSRNYFPIDFLARQAAQAMGIRLDGLPMPKRTIGLRLGNILTLARVSDQAAADTPIDRFDSAA